MAIDPITDRGWERGIDNRSSDRALPKGFVRDAVNVDPVPGGGFALRSGFVRVAEATDARGCLALGEHVLYLDGDSLMLYTEATGAWSVLAPANGARTLVGAVMNNTLFFCMGGASYRYDGSSLQQWGVPAMTVQPTATVVSGGFLAGDYQVAATLVDAEGREGGTTAPLLITLATGEGLQLATPQPNPGGSVRVYVGPRYGETLYLQWEGSGSCYLSRMVDDSAVLQTLNMRAPVAGTAVAALGGSLLVATEYGVAVTLPFHPHLMNYASGFFQYPVPPSVLVTVDDGAYVCADKTYFISGVNTPNPRQVTVSDFGGVAGTGTQLPDGRAAWMTPYGLAVGAPGGQVSLLSQANYVPQFGDTGATGVVEQNGNTLAVTSMQGTRGPNSLAARDYYSAEIVLP